MQTWEWYLGNVFFFKDEQFESRDLDLKLKYTMCHRSLQNHASSCFDGKYINVEFGEAILTHYLKDAEVICKSKSQYLCLPLMTLLLIRGSV